jgi:segregation and condensation protein A
MFRVQTPVFEGPLDLLLSLIEREDLDVTGISLVQVTDQYLAILRTADQIDLRALADFVAIGAKLLFLRSRALLPRSADEAQADDLEAEEIALELTSQLEEYRAFKNAASYLRQLDDVGHRSFARLAPPPADWLPTGLERVTLKQLLRALSNAMERLPVAPEPERLQRSVINVAERRQSVLVSVRRGGRLSFAGVIAACKTRLEAIVTFLAVLDLLKSAELRAEQASAFGEIVLSADGPAVAGSASA